MTEIEIKAKYKELHDLLSERYYNFYNISKEEFDIQHGKIWNDMEAELLAEGYRKSPEPPMDYETEINELKARLDGITKVGGIS